jgi:hypothetical protein
MRRWVIEISSGLLRDVTPGLRPRVKKTGPEGPVKTHIELADQI